MKQLFTLLALLLCLQASPAWAQVSKDTKKPSPAQSKSNDDDDDDDCRSIKNRIRGCGFVGIGTKNPQQPLDVVGNVRVSQTVFTNSLEAVGLKATNFSVAQDATIGRHLVVNGNTGLGVSTPVERLEVLGNAKISQELFSDKVTTGDGSFSRNVQIAQQLSVSGNTGLGVPTPVEKLEVGGNVKITQNLISDKINSGDGLFSRSLQVTKDFNVTGNTGLGIASATEKLEVAGNIKSTQGLLAQTAQIATDLSAGGNLSVTGNVGLGVAPGTNKLSVAGDSYFNGLLTAENVTVKQNLTLQGAFSVTGPFGIGVATPEAQLHVNGDGKFDGNVTANKIIVNAIEIAGSGQSSGTGLNLGDNLIVNGSVAIGTTKVSGYKLSVNGKIRASDDIKVYLESEWSDFVFNKDYKLRTLEEVSQYINKNGHLPEMPSAEVVKKDGIDLGAMDAKLLQKIEELTLYMIEMKKENEFLKKEISTIKRGKL